MSRRCADFINLRTLLYEEDYIGLFLLVTVVHGRRRRLARRPRHRRDLAAVVACGALHADPRAGACGSSISRCSRARCSRLQFYAVDTAVCLSSASSASALTRVAQMTTQYRWINEPGGIAALARRTDATRGKSDYRVTFPRLALQSGQRPSRRRAPDASTIHKGRCYEEIYHAWPGARRGDRACRHGAGADQDAASPARSPARTPPSARSSRTAPNRRSKTSTPPAASWARRSPSRYGDDVSDPKQGVSVANKFAGDGVKFVVGHFNSGVTMPASEVYQENGILEITPVRHQPEDHRARHVEHLPHLRP